MKCHSILNSTNRFWSNCICLSHINKRTFRLCLRVFSTLEIPRKQPAWCWPWPVLLTSADPFTVTAPQPDDPPHSTCSHLAASTNPGASGSRQCHSSGNYHLVLTLPTLRGDSLFFFPQQFRAKENEPVSPNRSRTRSTTECACRGLGGNSRASPNAIFFIFLYVLSLLILNF